MVSVGSVSTTGGVPFDELCRGEISNYSFNLVNLVEDKDSEKKGKMDRDVKKLSKKLKDTIKNLEIGPIDRKGSTIQDYYIGKTYIHKKKKRGGGFQKFNHMKENTWRKGGISSRYKSHSTKNYGRDGLVVLAAITKDALPKHHLRRITQEDYALILEQRLTHHLLINEGDDRVYNATFSEGRRQRKPQGINRTTNNSCADSDEKGAHAYAIYMAFKREKSYDENDDSTDDDEDKLTSPPVKKKPKLQQESKPKKDKLIEDLLFKKEYFKLQKKKKGKKVRFKLPKTAKHHYHPSVCPLRKPSSVLPPLILPKPRYHPTIRPLQKALPILLHNYRHHPTKREKSYDENDDSTHDEDKLTSPPVKKKPKLQQENKRINSKLIEGKSLIKIKKKNEKKVRFKSPIQQTKGPRSLPSCPQSRYHPTICPLQKALPILPHNYWHHPTIHPLQKALPILPHNYWHHPTIHPLQKSLPTIPFNPC